MIEAQTIRPTDPENDFVPGVAEEIPPSPPDGEEGGMSPPDPPPASLRHVLGALIFAAGRPISLEDMRGCLRAVTEAHPGRMSELFAESSPSDLRDAVADLRQDLERQGMGFEIAEVAGGFRLQSQPSCGAWVRMLLKKPPKTLLTQPALETLAIIAYRQPIPRAEIESIRGVSVGHVLKALMDVRLIRVSGRSDLPGRPFLYGTTIAFLEHFGLRNLSDLEQVDPTLKRAYADGTGRAAGTAVAAGSDGEPTRPRRRRASS